MKKNIVKGAPARKSEFPKPIDLVAEWHFARWATINLPSAQARCLLCMIERYNPGRGYAWPSQETLGELTSLHSRSSKRSTEALVRNGWLIKNVAEAEATPVSMSPHGTRSRQRSKLSWRERGRF